MTKEFNFKNSTVRIHGSVNKEKLEKSCINYIRNIERERRKKGK